jgi:protein-S-isoprenylcysteine O-methyltransferase Ste14
MKLISPLGLSATGAGPKIFRIMIPFFIIGIIMQFFFPAVSSFPFFKTTPLTYAGWILLVTGSLFWIWSIIQFLQEFPKGKLITSGVYSLSRNPIYASWIIFILPGLAGIFNNWIFLLTAAIMYIALVIYIQEEEMVLSEIFGEQYQNYAKKVNRVMFFPQILRTNKYTQLR